MKNLIKEIEKLKVPIDYTDAPGEERQAIRNEVIDDQEVRSEMILFAGYEQCPVKSFLETQSTVRAVAPNEKITDYNDCEWLVSYGYRKKIKKEVLDHFKNKAINLHIAMLPWNRGCSPNFWSFYDHTPKGVSIHLMSEDYDTGAILAQKEIHFKDETLSESYYKLRDEIENLFIKLWPVIPYIFPKPQNGNGSYHAFRETEDKLKELNITWDMKISEIEKLKL